MAFLVVDLGTSSCRASLVDPEGRVRVIARRPFEVRPGEAGRVEVDTEEAWAAVKEVLRAFRSALPEERPDFLGVSSFLGYVLLSKSLEPLAPAATYQDTSASLEAKELDARFPGAYEVTGRRMSPGLLAPILLKRLRERPELLDKTKHVYGLKDDLVRRLTGEVVTDFAHMNYTWLFDLASLGPHRPFCEALGIAPEVFPEARAAQVPAGRLTREAAAETGLAEGLPLVTGSIDGTTAMYGAGMALRKGFSLVTGSTDVFMALTERLPADKERILSVNTGMLPGTFAVGGATGQAGAAMAYYARLFKLSNAEAEEAVASLAPGDTEGLFVFPGLTGERSPYWNEKATGAVLGLKPCHGPAHILYAAMEACAFRLSRLKAVLGKAGISANLAYVSGGAAFPSWNKIRADVLGLPLVELEEKEATTLGTAMFCRAALDGKAGLDRSSGEWIRIGKRREPDRSRFEYYEKRRADFEEKLKEIHEDRPLEA